jgi:basic amino acid/polyamine antiporter, APA family
MNQSEVTNQPEEFKRTLTWLDGTMLVSGSMIGSGIFIVSADMGRTVGSAGWLIAVWLLTGVMTIFGALSYGELAGMMPKAGGQFVYIRRAFGDLTAFLYGWSVFAVITTGVIAAVAVAFAKYTAYFFPVFSPENVLFQIGSLKINAAQMLAIFILFLLTFINSLGVQNGKLIQLIFTSAKLIALFALIFLGLFFASKSYLAENFTNAWAGSLTLKDAAGNWQTDSITGVGMMLAFGTAFIGSLFSSDSWNNVTFIAGEIKDPRRSIPISLALGTTIVTLLYVLANLAYLNLLPLHGSPTATDVIGRGIMFAENERVGTAAASQIFGASSAGLMAALIMISTFGCVSGTSLSGARVYYAMSQAGLFFKKAGELNAAKVPGNALWMQCIWASLLCLTGTYGDLLDYCTFVSLIFYAVTIAAVFVLRQREPNAERPYKVPFYPFTPAIYIVLAVGICLILLVTKTTNTALGLLIVAAGVPFYMWQKRTNKVVE